MAPGSRTRPVCVCVCGVRGKPITPPCVESLLYSELLDTRGVTTQVVSSPSLESQARRKLEVLESEPLPPPAPSPRYKEGDSESVKQIERKWVASPRPGLRSKRGIQTQVWGPRVAFLLLDKRPEASLAKVGSRAGGGPR